MTDVYLPAWSEPFIGDRRSGLDREGPLGRLDRAVAIGGSDGTGVTVGIIDSGVERDHPAIGGRLVRSVRVEPGENEPAVVEDPDGIDVVGHGTACAGLIHALAPRAELVSIRVLGADLRGKGTAFAAGLEWAIEQRLPVCNLSLSSKSESLYPVFHDLADRAYFQGTALVSAANNVPAPSYPSLFSSVISVAAHAEPDPWRLYYNPSPPVEFGAWGVDVPIAWMGGSRSVATGNSFAAPHVAGLVALILSKHPGLTPFEVKAILASVADNPGRRRSRSKASPVAGR
jgi:subtilisin family serine protease